MIPLNTITTGVRTKAQDIVARLKRAVEDEGIKGLFKKGPWEMAVSIMIGLGVFMLMQPFFMWLYTYSFITILVGTVGFLIVSHFPE